MIIKKIDSVGRIVIPMEIRNTLNWKSNDEIELISKDDSLILKKHYPKQNVCCICGSNKKLINFSNNFVCQDCIDLLIEKNKNNLLL